MPDTFQDFDLPDLEETPSTSLLDRLREQRRAGKPKHLDLALPDWRAESGGIQIVARFKPIPYRGPVQQAIQRITKSETSPNAAQIQLDAECDVLIAGLEQLYARVDDGDLEPLDPDVPMRFDQRTSDALSLGAMKAREVVRALYGGEIGEMSIKAHAAAYVQFLQNLEVVTPDEGKY